MKLNLPDQFELLANSNPRAAFELMRDKLLGRLPYEGVSRHVIGAVKIALDIAWTVGQRDGMQKILDDIAGEKDDDDHDRQH